MSGIRYLNLALLILFPISWFAPLMRAGLLPFFKLDEVSVVSGIQSLWESDVVLSVIVTFFAIVAPYLKTIGLAFVHFGVMPRKFTPVMYIFGKLAMADIFLIALYIVIAKGVGVGRLEVAWGLYMFTACILASLAVTFFSARQPNS